MCRREKEREIERESTRERERKKREREKREIERDGERVCVYTCVSVCVCVCAREKKDRAIETEIVRAEQMEDVGHKHDAAPTLRLHAGLFHGTGPYIPEAYWTTPTTASTKTGGTSPHRAPAAQSQKSCGRGRCLHRGL